VVSLHCVLPEPKEKRMNPLRKLLEAIGVDPRTAQSFHEAELQSVRSHPRVHNFLNGDLLFHPNQDGSEATVSGFGYGLKVGDYLIKRDPDSGPDAQTRYRLTELRYCRDPSDQWFGKAVFAPRTIEQKNLDMDHTERHECCWDLDPTS
jgi:hypothetical protein